VGGALDDADFSGAGDRVRYRIAVRGAARVDVELRYQPIAFRWARNLAPYTAAEPAAFVGYYSAMAEYSSVVVSRASRRFEP
jgi:hypothetical protein